MLLEHLPSELLAQVFFSCASLSDVVNLASTCYRLHSVFASRKLRVLSEAVEAEYGPLQDAIQLVTQNASQPPHIQRFPPLSLSLLQQVQRVGRTAKRWEEIYPFKKWKENFEDRRILSPPERRLLRRALYRYWLFGAAFHTPAHPRWSRTYPHVVRERTALLHNWSNAELAEIEDVRRVLRDVLRHNVCPSNGTVLRKLRKRYPDAPPAALGFLNPTAHLNCPLGAFQHHFHSHHPKPGAPPAGPYLKYKPAATHDPVAEGWGDEIAHYYVVEDMMKLDPAQILLLRDAAPAKADVEAYVRGLGEWFENNGETFVQTLEEVLGARGEDAWEFLAAVEDGEVGVAVGDE